MEQSYATRRVHFIPQAVCPPLLPRRCDSVRSDSPSYAMSAYHSISARSSSSASSLYCLCLQQPLENPFLFLIPSAGTKLLTAGSGYRQRCESLALTQPLLQQMFSLPARVASGADCRWASMPAFLGRSSQSQRLINALWNVFMLRTALMVVVQEAQAQRHLMNGHGRQILQLWEDFVGAA